MVLTFTRLYLPGDCNIYGLGQIWDKSRLRHRRPEGTQCRKRKARNVLTSSSQDRTIEHQLIDSIKGLTEEKLIGDDCAILPGGELVTLDMLVEGTHFRLPDTSYEDLGWKAVAVNLSDIAAMAGRPRFIIIGLTLPSGFSKGDFERLFASMVDCGRQYRSRVVGGDLTRGQHLILSLTVIGEEHAQGVMRREGARHGDIVITTGDFGASAAGLYLMNNKLPGYEHCRLKHFRPQPRLAESWKLVEITGGTGGMMDASDGLADALLQLAGAGDVGIVVDEKAISIHQETRMVAKAAGVNPTEWALYGGEDYELVACVRPEHWKALQECAENPFVAIGEVVDAKQGVSLRQAGGKTQPISMSRTFQHWA